MPKQINIMVIVLFLVLGLFSLSFSQETMTITTYYPSPYGSYKELYVSDKLGIGTAGPIGKLQVGALPSNVDGPELGLYSNDRVNAAFYAGLGGVSIASNFDGYTEPYTTYGLVFTAMNSGSETTQFENWSIAPLNYDSTAHGLAFTGARTSDGTPTNMHVKTPFMLINTDGKVGIGTTSPTTILSVVQTSATDPIADAWTVYSSRRWKENIQPLDGALEKVLRLRGVTFDWKADGKHDIGMIAEEVGEVIPEVVAYEENGTDAKSLDYARLTALLVEAVKEQQGQIVTLQQKVAELKGKM